MSTVPVPRKRLVELAAHLAKDLDCDRSLTFARWLRLVVTQTEPEPEKSALARIVVLCEHCGEPMPDDVTVCPANELDTATEGAVRTVLLGPHEPDADSTEMVCECGASCTGWAYEEDYFTTRTVDGFEDGMLCVDGHFEWGDGNGTPGLVCNNGCGRSIELPDDIDINWT